MKYIINYKSYLYCESRGISDSSEDTLYSLWSLMKDDITNKLGNIISYHIERINETIEVEYNFIAHFENRCIGLADVRNNRIILNIYHNDMTEEFIYYIKSVLLHELLHIHQYYHVSDYNPDHFSVGTMISQFRNIFKTNYILYLLDIIYYSLPFEVSAHLHQYYLYKSNGNEYNRLTEMINMFKNFHIKDSLDSYEETELNKMKEYIIKAIDVHSNGEYKLKDNSIWLKDNKSFLKALSRILDKRLKFIDKKKEIIDSKLIEEIDYSVYQTFPDDLHFYNISESYLFIKENLRMKQDMI